MQQVTALRPHGDSSVNFEVVQTSYYRARYYDQNAGRFLGEDPSGFTDGTNRYVYVGSRPTILMDPTGLLAELYCERLDSLRGGDAYGDLIVTLSQAQHCFIRIVSDGKDETFELYGPGEDPKRGTPHINPYNPFRLARRFKIYPPPNMICGQFEDRLRRAYKREGGRVPIYVPTGPNSNTFVNQIIQDAGGDADFPIGAYGADKGLRP